MKNSNFKGSLWLLVLTILWACTAPPGLATPQQQPEKKITIVDQAHAYLKDKPNGVVVLISDGYKDKATGKQIADAFKAWFLKDYGIKVVCFIDAPETLAYSGVSFIVKDQPIGPYSLLEAKAKMSDVAATYDAKIEERTRSARAKE